MAIASLEKCELKTNLFRERALKGELQIGTWINMVRNPAILPLLKSAGFDFARLDMEHSPYSMETVADMAMLARALDFPFAVRPTDGSRETLTRLLDSGVWNLHVPGIDTAEQAREVAQASRYAPLGLRGQMGIGGHTDFEAVGTVERLKFQNDQIFITIMLETRLAFENLEEIASVDGIEALTLGPSDLAQDLGVLGTPDQDKVLNEHRLRLIDAAKRHGKSVAMLGGTASAIKWAVDNGATIITYSSDVAVLHDAFTSQLKEIRSALTT